MTRSATPLVLLLGVVTIAARTGAQSFVRCDEGPLRSHGFVMATDGASGRPLQFGGAGQT